MIGLVHGEKSAAHVSRIYMKLSLTFASCFDSAFVLVKSPLDSMQVFVFFIKSNLLCFRLSKWHIHNSILQKS